MRKLLLVAAACLGLPGSAALAQMDDSQPDADYIASAGQPGAGQQRAGVPLVGVRRRADHLVLMVAFTSDSRDAVVRTTEIHTMLLGALAKAGPAGLELATGSPVLTPLTRDNYKNVTFTWAGREDTSKATVMVKVPLGDDPAEAEKRVNAFVRSLERNGRGTIYREGARLVAVSNPAQYRGDIVRLIAEDARTNAAAFGPDYRVSVDGIDKPVQWVQLNGTEVFLYLPYTYRIVAQ